MKSQLYSYFLDILNELSNYSTDKLNSYKNINYQNLNVTELIKNIKDSTNDLIIAKTSKIMMDKDNYKTYNQLENYTRKLEHDIKLFYRKYFYHKLQNDALEDKIKAYRIIQEKYEELKDKVKYVGGRFLDNEKKDNEIIILRQENNILKKEVEKLDKFNKLNETLVKNYLCKIKKLQSEIEHLNKKLESKYNPNNSNSNYNSSNATNINLNNNNENILSKLIPKHDSDNANNIISNNSTLKNHYNCLKGIKTLFHKNTINNRKRPSNYTKIKSIYMNSNNSIRNNFNCSTISTINTNIFTSNYHKLMNNISGHRKNNSKNKYKKNQKKSTSLSMKFEKEEEKSLSMNKYLKNFNDMYKSDYKTKKTYHKIINFKSNENCPLSCQHKNRKYLNNKIRTNKIHHKDKMKKSNSALNIKVFSK